MIRIEINRKYKPPKAKVSRFKEFSKKVIIAFAVAWFIGFVFALAVVLVQVWRGDMTVNLSDLLLYIGAPMSGGIITYMLKSAFENREKIRSERDNGQA